MQMQTDTKTDRARARFLLPRRLKNHWVSHNHNMLHLFLGSLFTVLFILGSLVQSSADTDPPVLAQRLHLVGFIGLFSVLLLVFLHTNLHGTNRFLRHFQDTAHLPAAQMQQVSSFCMILFLAAAALSMACGALFLPALWALAASWFSGRLPQDTPGPDIAILPDAAIESPDLAALVQQAGDAPFWLPVLEALASAAAVLVISALVFLTIYQWARRLFAFFLRIRKWDDDEKIFLKPTLLHMAPPKGPTDAGTKKPFRFFPGPLSFRDAIRRHYRRTIQTGLKKQKKPAEPWASPAELEASASCCAPTLHQIYEKARYAPSECTTEDLKCLGLAQSFHKDRKKQV